MANSLKGMSRRELLELLVAQMEENETLRRRLEEAEAELAQRRIVTDEAGSIAEAALRLNGVFAAAEEAAQQYRESVEAAARERAEAIMAEAEEYRRAARAAASQYKSAKD